MRRCLHRAAAQSFPSLTVGRSTTNAQGSFAENLQDFLAPDQTTVKQLEAGLKQKKIGVVAHYYMDAELQGTLAALDYEHAFSADSLAMGHAAVKMADAGIDKIVCLGVDFMSESVRSTLDQAGHTSVSVLRCADNQIGCSLAEAADNEKYLAWLRKAKETPNALHVVYINTSIESKARCHDTIPTLTCTSSNVVFSVLQADIDIPGVSIFYGPDTYMGANLKSMLATYAQMSDEAIRQIHPAHNQASLTSLLERFHYYQDGMCVVHHMFGDQVVEKLRTEYPLDEQTFYTAHLEVPGEMFELAFEAQQKGMGVVGSTANILNFITNKTKEAEAKGLKNVRFVLGTESGMVTSIVNGVRALKSTTTAEIIFPVNSSAVSQTSDPVLKVVPGVQGGEGCSTAGGCASCPFMKMNDLDGLMNLVERLPVGHPADDLAIRVVKSRLGERVSSGTIAEVGGQPIKFMNHLMRNKSLPTELVQSVSQ